MLVPESRPPREKIQAKKEEKNRARKIRLETNCLDFKYLAIASKREIIQI